MRLGLTVEIARSPWMVSLGIQFGGRDLELQWGSLLERDLAVTSRTWEGRLLGQLGRLSMWSYFTPD